jgi:hypothetical protein
MFKFIIILHCVLQWVKPMGEGALPKCGAELNYHLILGPLFENAATIWARCGQHRVDLWRVKPPDRGIPKISVPPAQKLRAGYFGTPLPKGFT